MDMGENYYLTDFSMTTHHVWVGGEAVGGLVEYSLSLMRPVEDGVWRLEATLSPASRIQVTRAHFEKYVEEWTWTRTS